MSLSDPTDPSAAPPSRLPLDPALPARVDIDYAAPRRPEERKSKDRSDFWRATRYIYPYRRIVLISITCAFFVGAAVSGGLTTMLPIMRVLLAGQTVSHWVDSQIAEARLGVRLADDNSDVRVLEVKPNSPAAAAGLERFDQLHLPGSEKADLTRAAGTLDALANPQQTSILLARENKPPVTVNLDPAPAAWAYGRRVAAHISPKPVWAIGQIFIAVAALAVFSNVLKFFQEYLSDKAAILAVNDLRRHLYDHVLHVPLSHFGRRGTSDVTSRLVGDSASLEQGFKTVLGQSIQEPMKALFAFGLALIVSWKLTLAIVVFGPLMGAIIQKFGKKMRRASRAALQKSSLMLGQIDSTLSGIRVVKGASAERFERRRYSGIMRKLNLEQLRMSRIDAFSAPTLETLTLFVVIPIVLIATYMVTETHTLDVIQFFLVMACLGTIADSLRRLNKVNSVLQKANAAATRVFEVMDLPVERERVGGKREARRHEGTEARRGEKTEGDAHVEATGTGDSMETKNGDASSALRAPVPSSLRASPARIKLPPLQREVRFENITFAYPGAPAPVLLDVNLTVPKGKSVAVVGRNGSGKTTLLGLLPRFYDPDRGRITIDGVDVRDATLRSLRGQISIVTQDSVIFPGTIAENIAYGHPLASRLRGNGAKSASHNSTDAAALRAEVEAAARRAFAHEFILEKPLGYDTVLGGMGGQLSGGQKQRVCIARAILRQAPILVLDEATSQVDAESEHLIQQAIEGLMHERTTFVIAHRFSTILGADSIVVMDRGRIVGQGKHDELLRTCETYQQLYERQLFAAPAA